MFLPTATSPSLPSVGAITSLDIGTLTVTEQTAFLLLPSAAAQVMTALPGALAVIFPL